MSPGCEVAKAGILAGESNPSRKHKQAYDSPTPPASPCPFSNSKAKTNSVCRQHAVVGEAVHSLTHSVDVHDPNSSVRPTRHEKKPGVYLLLWGTTTPFLFLDLEISWHGPPSPTMLMSFSTITTIPSVFSFPVSRRTRGGRP
jgi:hypothetical protein